MTDTFTPRPGSAPLSRQVLAQAAMEAKLMLRNGEQLLLAIVIPVIALVGGVAASDRFGLDFDHRAVDVLSPGVLALAVMSTAFTSLAIATGFERRYGLLKRLGVSPLSRLGLLGGKIGAVLMVVALQLVVLSGVALALGWRPEVTGFLFLIPIALLGTAAFASLGLAMAGTLRAEATLAAANLVYLLLMAGGGIVLPASSYGAFGHVVRFLPSGALGDALRSAFLDGQFAPLPVLVLAAWTAVGTLLAARYFSWE